MFHSQGHKKSFWLQIDIVKICTWHIRTLLWQTHLKQKNCLRLVSRTGYVEELGNQIWQSPCGASGARPGHCWQVSQHWPGVMLECGRETICLHPSACHCRSRGCMTQQPGSETATYSSWDWISRTRQSNSSWNWFGPISILHDSLDNQTKWLHWKLFMFPHENQIGASKQFIQSNSTNQTWVL